MLERQRKFVEYVIQGHSGTRAVVMAGYSEKGADVRASKLMKNEEIKAAIDKAHEEIRKETKWDKARLINSIERVIESALNSCGESRPNESAALKGYELIGRYIKVEEEASSDRPRNFAFEIIEPKKETA
ncbi:MAG: terminase small subunit [Fibromonadales bacterium]|nr:terminase small subunit [Fibromonadales bacterium]